jgi:hypothetical protein
VVNPVRTATGLLEDGLPSHARPSASISDMRQCLRTWLSDSMANGHGRPKLVGGLRLTAAGDRCR